QGSEGNAINVFANGNLASGASIVGKIRNNIIGTLNTDKSGSLLGRGIDVSNEGSINTTLSITGNAINETYADSIFYIQNVNAVNAGTTHLTISGNTLQNFYTLPNPSNAFGISVNLTTTGTLNVSISGNTLTDASNTIVANKIRIRRTNGTFNVTQVDEATVGTANGLPGAGEVDALGTINFNQAAPTLPPLLFSGEASSSSGGSTLTMDSLSALASAAIARWTASGLTTEQSALLHNINFGITDLPEGYLGTATPGLVLLSGDAAGNVWFIDLTPNDDSEFTGNGLTLTATSGGGAEGSVDALTVIMHELGHQLGFEDGYGSSIGGPLMEGHLTLGQRLLPQPGSALSLPAGGMVQSGALPLTFQSPVSTFTSTNANAGQVMLPRTGSAPRVDVRILGTRGAKPAVYSSPLDWSQTLPVPALHVDEFLIIPLFELSPFGGFDLPLEDALVPLPVEFQRASFLPRDSAPETKGTSASR
ncbi:MAG TPA: hypothetical protein VLE43_01515, partial [Candidatus Saccharimonadia bacterium]|nr:hypothetical protein [Candidatus Saccharimonadia bacterium]